MQTQYFDGCETVKDVKDAYRQLIREVHPDLHPEDEFEIWNRKAANLNDAYHAALKGRDRETYVGSDSEEHTYYYNEAKEQAVIDKIEELIAANLSDHIDIWIIGTWVWVTGTRREDKEDREKLKDAKLRWHSKRKKWYWHQPSYRRSYNKDLSFEDLKHMHGARKAEKDEDTERAKAAIAA